MNRLFPALAIFLMPLGIPARSLGVVLLESQGSLLELLPAGAETRGWKAVDKPQVFQKETLFEYIDGGAEIYLEYGFRRSVVQEYRNESKGSVVLEVFEMESSRSAFGMYTFKTASSGRKVSIGQGGQLADYYLNFWKGDFLVTLTGGDETARTLDGLTSLGAAVARRIPANGVVPKAVSLLPDQGRTVTGLKYFMGPLGVQNSYAFFTENVFGVGEAAKADYSPGYSLYVFLYLDREACRMRFSAVEKAFRESERYAGFARLEDGRFRVKDGKGRTIVVAVSGTFILAVMGIEDPQVIDQAIATIKERQRQKGAGPASSRHLGSMGQMSGFEDTEHGLDVRSQADETGTAFAFDTIVEPLQARLNLTISIGNIIFSPLGPLDLMPQEVGL